MFKIYDGRTHFWQWDIDCKLVVEDASIKQVHFYNSTSECSLVVLIDDNGLVDVPNILLQSDRDIHVYAYDGVTKAEECFKVFARSKPADYVYTETEVLSYNTLLEKINEVDKNIGVAVKDYLTEHPIEAGATEEQAAQIEQNRLDIIEIQNAGYITSIPDDYAKKTDVAAAVLDKVTNEQLSNAIADFITESEVDNKISAIDMSGYALKTEIPDVSGFITETQMNTAIQDALSTLVDGEAVSY